MTERHEHDDAPDDAEEHVAALPPAVAATLHRLHVAHRRVHRPSPALRVRVSGAVAADRRHEQVRYWLGGSLVGALMGAAALLVAHWVAVTVVARGPAEPTPGEAEYQSPRDGRPGVATSRPEGTAGATAPAASEGPPPSSPTETAAEARADSNTAAEADAAKRAPALDRSAPAPDLAAEVRLLRQAEVALSTDPAEALALLRTHVRKFPRTSLPLERRALQILARCGTSPDAAAIAERDAFLREHPGSPYAARVRAACRA